MGDLPKSIHIITTLGRTNSSGAPLVVEINPAYLFEKREVVRNIVGHHAEFEQLYVIALQKMALVHHHEHVWMPGSARFVLAPDELVVVPQRLATGSLYVMETYFGWRVNLDADEPYYTDGISWLALEKLCADLFGWIGPMVI